MQTHTFICGCGHSGTSLMAAMFASHAEVFIPLRETEAFLARDAVAERLAALLAEARASGRPHLAEKTPRHVRRIAMIRRRVPGARFVAMVRDGRDVAASFIRRLGAAEPGARRWIADNTALGREQDAPDVMVVRYEDLIEAPEAVLRRVCAFAGIGFDARMLRHHETPRLWFDVPDMTPGDGTNGIEHRRRRNWQINQPLFDGRGQWKELLSEEDLALFATDEARALMARFGYT